MEAPAPNPGRAGGEGAELNVRPADEPPPRYTLPQSRKSGEAKAIQILAALEERISQRGIARALKVSRDMIRALRIA